MINKTIPNLAAALTSLLMLIFPLVRSAHAADCDLIIYNARILTVDKDFSIAQALAVKGSKFIAVGSNDEIIKLAGGSTEKVDLKGKTVIPGLIEAHLHPELASTSELFDEIPDVHTINELLEWVKSQAQKKKPGQWIVFPKFFPTRLIEMREPTKDELDKAAPQNPVFLNGSYAGVINSVALNISGISKNTKNPGILKDPDTGRPTGFIRASAFSLLKNLPSPELTYEEKLNALADMLKRYNSVGITSVTSGAGGNENLKMYRELKKSGRLTARVFQNIFIRFDLTAPIEEIRKNILNLGYHTGSGDEWVRVGALKTSMDGGILTGTAYMRQPWGSRAKKIFGITDPAYRGVLKITKEQLIPIADIANQIGWKFTAHCTGGGAVDIMLDAFEEVNKSRPIKDRRFSIIHGNFFTPQAIEKMKALGVYADAQPVWFYKDADALKYVLGDERIETFLPFRSLFDAGVIVNGGSDHMVKFDSYSAINPYNPFLSMYTAVTRKTERGSIITPQEAITRQQALKMYTINNAYASFEEDIKGSIEPGKLADFAVLDTDLLSCPADDIKDIKVLATYLDGRLIYKQK
jgi:predicted amidohydrolase YtcJ